MGILSTQLELFNTPESEADLYHHWDGQGFPGFFALLTGTDGGGKRQQSYPLPRMAQVLSLLDRRRDTWLSQAEFIRPNRRVVNLLRLGLLFADLDTYRQPWAAGRTPEQLTAALLYHCGEEGIPPPSLVIYSGRGLQAKWLLTAAIPRAALPRWSLCQRYLIDRLAPMGADPAAKDASRVLRVTGTVNVRSGEVCRVVHVTDGPDGDPVRYSFEYLCELLLPVARSDIEAARRERAERAERRRQQLQLIPGGKTDHLRGFSGRQLAWDRLEDLRRLAELRGGVREGERMLHLFWRLNFLLLSGATHSSQLYHEAAALARELDPRWGYRSAELMTLYSKARAYEAGETIEFAGRRWPPLYTPRNDTLINIFAITDEEQRKLRTIISRDMAAERDRERITARRRAAGVVDRASYLERAQARREQARLLRAQGLSVRAIAERLGISVGAVSGYLKDADA